MRRVTPLAATAASASADARRDHLLERLGYRALRPEAELVARQLPVVLERIREALRASSIERR